MDALVLVDLQNDFMPGGALGVSGGDATVPVANALSARFELVVASRDWHPPNHGSFVTAHPGKAVGDIVTLGGLDQVVWPVHCVQDTWGAAFHDDLDTSRFAEVVSKGTDPGIDSYSAFFDNAHRRATGLEQILRRAGVTRLYLMGLATDYCVKYTALDARQLDFETVVVEDGCRGVNLAPDDSAKAVEEMRAAGVEISDSAGVGPS